MNSIKTYKRNSVNIIIQSEKIDTSIMKSNFFDKYNSDFKSGLKYLVIYHRITGITYLGWNFREPTTKWKKILWLLWQSCLFILALYFTYHELKPFFNLEQQKAKLAASPKSILVFSLIQMGNIGYILT